MRHFFTDVDLRGFRVDKPPKFNWVGEDLGVFVGLMKRQVRPLAGFTGIRALLLLLGNLGILQDGSHAFFLLLPLLLLKGLLLEFVLHLLHEVGSGLEALTAAGGGGVD